MIWFKRRKRADTPIKLSLTTADPGPDDLAPQLPVTITLIKKIPGSDRSDYWLAKAEKPISWKDRQIEYLIVGSRFFGKELVKGVGEIVLNVAYVLDHSLLDDTKLDFEKCAHVAICFSSEIP